MTRRHRAEEQPEEAASSGPMAGAVVLTALGTGAVAGVVAVSAPAGILGLWAVGTGALWWAMRRPVQGAANPAPPPGEKRPTCSECAGHILIGVTPLSGPQEGMLIYKSAPPDRPHHTHIHIRQDVNAA